MQTQYPKQLQYNQLQTKAFYSVYKQWPIQPVANGGQYWPGQVIRIFLNALTEGVMDPYRSHIQITVSCDTTTLPVGLLQLDNSAQSFIQQLVISSKNRQIQRIIQYGALAAYLTDIGMAQVYAEGKQVQGLGYSNIDNFSNIYNCSTTAAGMNVQGINLDGTQVQKPALSQGTVFPTIPTKYNIMTGHSTQSVAVASLSGAFRGHMTWLNTNWSVQDQQVWWWQQGITSNTAATNLSVNPRVNQLAYYGYTQNLRSQYLASHQSNNYLDTNATLSKYQLRLLQSVQNNTFPATFTNGVPYNVYVPAVVPFRYSWQNATGTATELSLLQIPNLNSLTGYTNLISPLFAKGVRQPFISPTVPQCQMANGCMLPQKIPVSQRTFKIPIISAILGLLIPKQQFVLIPLRALNDVLMELTVDPFAMFTSGYNDIAQFDHVGMGLMQQRAFKVNRIVYNLHTYQFYSPQMDQYLKVNLTSGIAINTHFWQLGNQYQIQNSQSLTNSWPVACNQQALNEILVLFYPLDYQNMSFCRKHFRLSNNITKMQLRINMDYFPSQPLAGNGGNPIELDSTGNNSIFLQQIFQTNGYMFAHDSPMPRINAFNFAINDRCYDIFNSHTLYDPAMINNPNYPWNQSSINTDTAMGISNLHENRYVGKAAYVFSFQPYTHSKDLLTGIDCRLAKQFDIIFGCNPINWFPRPQMMLIFTRSANIIQYGKQGIINVSK